MITLITGAPGMGKTSLVVSELLKMPIERPIYVDGIRDLTLPNPNVYLDEIDVLNWHKETPPGSLIVIDEAQRYFRPRPTGSTPPQAVQALETHRHSGHDIYFITQSPLLLDSNIRRLVGKHIHIRQTALGRYLYEWMEVGDIDNKASRDLAARRKYKPPREAFDKYKSAEIHTRQKFKLTTPMMVLVGVAAIGIPVGYYIYNSITSKVEKPVLVDQGAARGEAAQPPTPNGAPGHDYRASDYVPVLFNVPNSAPIYNDLRKPKTSPRIAACIAGRTRCKCYTQQGTSIPGISPDYCNTLAREGLPFNDQLDEQSAGDGGAAPHIDAAAANHST